MFKVPSLQHEYTLVFSGDPALNLPADEKERETALRVARETGRWHELCHTDQMPTIFKLRPLPHSAFEWLIGQSGRARLHEVELATLAVRLALRGVENLEGANGQPLKVETTAGDGQVLATRDVTDALAAIDRNILAELGGEILRRAQEGIRPKS